MKYIPDSAFDEQVLKYAQKSLRYKNITKQYEQEKAAFYNLAEAYFEENEIGSEGHISTYDDALVYSGSFKVSKVVKTSVDFDVESLSETLGKDLSKKAIIKKYEINDMPGLIRYLKSCKVDPNIFKSFLSITSSVNEQALDRLEELGEITMQDISHCYKVARKTSYFKVAALKEGSD